MFWTPFSLYKQIVFESFRLYYHQKSLSINQYTGDVLLHLGILGLNQNLLAVHLGILQPIWCSNSPELKGYLLLLEA